MGVGGGGGTSESDFFNKESKSTKKNFVPFFFEGVGRGGGASLSDFFKEKKTNLKKIGGVRRGGVG